MKYQSPDSSTTQGAVSPSQVLPPGLVPFLTGSFLSNIGSWMQMVAQGWLVAELSREPFWTGFVGFCSGVPFLLFSFAAGALADRMNRRLVLLVSQVVLMLIASILALLTSLHIVAIWHVAGLAFFTGLASAVSLPAYNGFLYDIVGREGVKRAVSLNATQFHLSRMIGPAAAGLCLTWVGAWGCFALNALSFLAVIPVIGMVPTFVKQDFRGGEQGSFLKSLQGALKYVGKERVIWLSLITIALTSTLVMPHITLLPLYVKEYLYLGAKDLGWMWASSALGSVLATLTYERISSHLERRKANELIAFGLLGALALAGLASFSHLAVIHFFLLMIGWSVSFVGVGSQTLLQHEVIPEMRGRALGIWGTLFQGMFPVGNIIVGSLAQGFTIPHAWLIASVTLFLSLLWVRFGSGLGYGTEQ